MRTHSLNLHPNITEKLSFFEVAHLPEPLFSVANQCRITANEIVAMVDNHPQLTLGLQHLIEAKDCFVRAAVARKMHVRVILILERLFRVLMR